MGKMKELGQYLQGTCIHFEGCVQMDFDDPLPTADFVNYRVEGENVIIVRHCNGCDELEEDVITPGKDFIYICDCPNDEEPFEFFPSARICKAMILQFRNTHGKEPDGARLYAKFESGADGYTVCCEYTREKPFSAAYAFMLESNVPEKWSPAALRYLETGK